MQVVEKELTDLRVMLVDDSPFDRGMIRRELRSEFGVVDLVEVTNQIELDREIESGPFDLVVTDFQIRWTDGMKVLELAKQRWPDCPVIMFTATGNEEIAVQAMKSGLDDYVIKNPHHFVRLRVAARGAIEHARTRTKAAQLEIRLTSLLGHLQVGVFRRKADGTIIEANQAAAKILGYRQPDELVGKSLAGWIKTVVNPDEALHSIRRPMISVELSMTRVDGTVIRVTVTEHMTTGMNGAIQFEGIIEDVTARRKTEDELVRVYDHMAHLARVNTMSEMAAGISHELNQPLSAISNYAAAVQIAMNDKSPGEKTCQDVQQIQDLAYQCGEIIRGLRDFTNRRPRQQNKASIAELVRKTIDMLQFEIRMADVVLSVNMPVSEIVVEGDCIQIQQVLVNLVSNAIESICRNETSDRTLTIDISVNHENLEVRVIDTGTGIPKEVMERLFEPFVTSKPDGTGIGLSISSRIINSHGGELRAWNNDGNGATFHFNLPIESGTCP